MPQMKLPTRILSILFASLIAATACARAPSGAPAGTLPNPNDTAAPTTAVSGTSGRVGGVVQGVNGGTVALMGGERFSLTTNARIIRSIPVDPTALHAGAFVAVTAQRQPDGTLLASVVNIFPESMRGLGEGQRPMDGGNLMTNATVNQVGGPGFSVLFPGGGDQVRLAEDAKVSQFETADVADLVPGTSITASLTNGAAQFITIL